MGAPAYTLAWPIFLAFDQTWTIAANDTLNVTGPVSGGGSVRIKGGGTVNLNAATEMGAVTITNATVALDFAGTLRMASFTVYGEPMPPGIYGASDNASVPAQNRLSCLTGPGRLLFGAGIGSVLTIR